MFNKKSIKELKKVNQSLIEKTHQLNLENNEMQNSLSRLYGVFQVFTGENTVNELGIPKELVIDYHSLRLRSWEFMLKNHIAGLLVNKRVNWQIGSGLLFNARPSEKPFIDHFGAALSLEKQKKLINDFEYLFRNYAKTKLCDYSSEKNLHELCRHTDYNASGDGDALIVMRVKNGFPNVQVISGQCLENPLLTEEIALGNSVNEGVEYNENGEVEAYHILVNTDISNGVVTPMPNIKEFGTKRISAYFKGTKIRSAWLYKQSDLQKAGETRAMPLLTHIFEVLKHLNDYLIANSKNAQLLSQMVFAFERKAFTSNEKMFTDQSLSSLGMDATTPESTATDIQVAAAANSSEFKMSGNGIVMDLPKGVEAKILNATAQSDQSEYLKSTMQTITAAINQPLEVTLSSYNSNYTASMGARSDFQYTLDVMTELIPANQFYRKIYEMFVYIKVLSGEIDCPPLLKAYNSDDVITIQAITNSSFEGTKLKPIDPLKFVKALREQMPMSARDTMPLNTMENLINAASGLDFESVISQVSKEISELPEELKPEIDENIQVQE